MPFFENRLLFLGTGTSTGVPVLGCNCRVCRSEDPHDKRSRVSVLLKTRCLPDPAEKNASPINWNYVLIDTSIDLRAQFFRAGTPLVNQVVYTHAHVDHFFGLDELRVIQYYLQGPIHIYCSEEVHHRLEVVYAHIFDPYVQKGGGILSVEVHPAEGRFRAGAMELLTLPVFHGGQPVQGYRWGGLAYITDCSHIPDSTLELLEGVEVLVLDALRHKSHETHFNLEQALAVVECLKPRQTWFIHMTHDLQHAETNAGLPEGVELSYDGLEIELSSFDPSKWVL